MTLATLDPHDPTHLADPYPAWAAARATEAVTYVHALRAWAVTRHDLVLTVVRDPATYSSAASPNSLHELNAIRAEVPGACPEDHPALANNDPPAHTRVRKLAQRALTPTAVAARESRIRAVAAELIEGFAAERRADVIARLAVPLPLAVVSTVIGMDPARWRQLKRWSDDTVRFHMPGLSRCERTALARSSADLSAFLEDLVTERGARPKEDLISALAHARIDGAPALTTEEVVGVATQLLIGGHETLTALIGRMLLLLGQDPTLLERIRADLSLAPAMVEESLRYRSPVKGMMRTTTREVTLGGQRLPAGARVLVLYGAANRDPSRFDHPDRFDLDREDVAHHVAFGKGVHFCIGAPLARLEARIALEEIVTRLPRLRLAGGQQLAYLPSFMVDGMSALELEWDRPDTTGSTLN